MAQKTNCNPEGLIESLREAIFSVKIEAIFTVLELFFSEGFSADKKKRDYCAKEARNNKPTTGSAVILNKLKNLALLW